jgi:hypothetical protein
MAVRGELTFEFEQPEAATTRGGLTNYPPAIDMGVVPIPRCVFEHVVVRAGMHGIKAVGNCGGLYIGRYEGGTFGNDIHIDGPLDFIHIESVHVWPFGIVQNADWLAMYYDGVGTAFLGGRVDGWVCGKFSTFRKRILVDGPGSTVGSESSLPMTFNSLQLDGNGAGIKVNYGAHVHVGMLYATAHEYTPAAQITVEGGDLTVGQVTMTGGNTLGLVRVLDGRCRINGGRIHHTSVDVAAASVPGGELFINNTEFIWAATVRTVAFVSQSGAGKMRVNGCWPRNYSPATVVARYNTDVVGNYFYGPSLRPHTLQTPAGTANGFYAA